MYDYKKGSTGDIGNEFNKLRILIRRIKRRSSLGLECKPDGTE